MNTWLVNTNSKPNNNNPNGFKFMLRQNKAAAYYGKKDAIDQIAPNDMVLLYHNQNRVIAVGFVLENTPHDFEDLTEVEHWVDVNWIWKAKFDDNFEPSNPINRYDLNISMVNGTVINISGQINYKSLFEQMALRQEFL